MTQVPLIGLIASFASSVSLFPSIHKAMTQKTAVHIAWPSLIITAIASICWLIYGWLNNLWPSIISSGALLISSIVLGINLYIHTNKN